MPNTTQDLTEIKDNPEELGGILSAPETEKESEEAYTEQPVAISTFWQKEYWLYLALAVVLLLLAGIIFGTRKKKKSSVSDSQEGEATTEKDGTEQPMTAVEKIEERPEEIPVCVGKVHEQGAREEQQDSFGVSDVKDVESYRQRGILAVVADGMGGLSNGGAVSSLLVCTCHNSFNTQPPHISPADMLVEMAIKSNASVNRMLPVRGQSGSTLVSAIIRDGYLYFLTIGDSRIYLYRGGALLQLNREHIYREELVLDAVNQKSDGRYIHTDPQAKSLTSYLGIGIIPHLDRNQEGIRLISKDKILLASDGVFGTLTPEQLEAALSLSAEEGAEQICRMIQEADRPYQDNYTALILEYQG